MSLKPGPLRLQPVFLPKVWAPEALPEGLAGLYGCPPHTGELWLASDRHHQTPVAEGELGGMGLDQVVAEFGGWITGADDGEGFPWLMKILTVGQWLSVQVHPDDEAARRLEGEPNGKSEAWHVLCADNGAEIIHGLQPGVDREGVARAVAEGAVGSVLARVPAPRGATFFMPAGTIHSPGPGLTILEIQQPSDLTYRFYDWDRPDRDGSMRELHVDKALEVLVPTGPGRPVEPSTAGAFTLLVEDLRFALYAARLSEAVAAPPSRGGPQLVLVTAGEAQLDAEGYERRRVQAGQCWLIPAGVTHWRLEPAGDAVDIFVAGAARATRERRAEGGEGCS